MVTSAGLLDPGKTSGLNCSVELLKGHLGITAWMPQLPSTTCQCMSLCQLSEYLQVITRSAGMVLAQQSDPDMHRSVREQYPNFRLGRADRPLCLQRLTAQSDRFDALSRCGVLPDHVTHLSDLEVDYQGNSRYGLVLQCSSCPCQRSSSVQEPSGL